MLLLLSFSPIEKERKAKKSKIAGISFGFFSDCCSSCPEYEEVNRLEEDRVCSFQGGSNIIYINLNVYRERPPARSMGIVYMVIMQIVITDILGHAPFFRKQLNDAYPAPPIL